MAGEKPRLGIDVFSALSGDQSSGSALPPPPGHAPPPAPAASQIPPAEAGVLDDDHGDGTAAPAKEASAIAETSQDAECSRLAAPSLVVMGRRHLTRVMLLR